MYRKLSVSKRDTDMESHFTLPHALDQFYIEVILGLTYVRFPAFSVFFLSPGKSE
jgi:hypothetical protein